VPKYPELPPDRIVAALQRLGFYVRRQRGSHVVMRRDQPFAQTIVPHHRTMKPTILAEILRQANISLDDFLKLL
jgi:predicted RNA binding protein YcfA (HicA-like mRNA interferase family)